MFIQINSKKSEIRFWETEYNFQSIIKNAAASQSNSLYFFLCQSNRITLIMPSLCTVFVFMWPMGSLASLMHWTQYSSKNVIVHQEHWPETFEIESGIFLSSLILWCQPWRNLEMREARGNSAWKWEVHIKSISVGRKKYIERVFQKWKRFWKFKGKKKHCMWLARELLCPW